ncbi:hypothetical protein [Streptomyces sp. PsTaAH-137]|uniref:hypothetical protein n=1 Tax=Streptomyces sp. PsTaAH-137 TaxID=1305830 RepID=UPI0035CEE849
MGDLTCLRPPCVEPVLNAGQFHAEQRGRAEREDGGARGPHLGGAPVAVRQMPFEAGQFAGFAGFKASRT